MKQKEEQILLQIPWNIQTECTLAVLKGLWNKYSLVALRHCDAAMLKTLSLICINWFDTWKHISYNGAQKKKKGGGDIIF